MRGNRGIAGLLIVALVALVACNGALGNPPRLASGTTIAASAMSQISSASNRPGDATQVRVVRDVIAADGKTVVIPAGSVITLGIAQIAGAPARGEKGTLVMSAKSIDVSGKTYPLAAAVTNYQYEMKAHAIGVNEVAKTGVGAVVGAVVGNAVAGKTGTVVGAVGGGAVGAVIAAKDLDRDLIVHTGSSVTLTLRQAFVRH